jgi:hypothetical protein
MSNLTPDDIMVFDMVFDPNDLGLLVCATLAFTMGVRGIEPDTKEQEQKYIELRKAAQRVGAEIGIRLKDWEPSDWQAV